MSTQVDVDPRRRERDPVRPRVGGGSCDRGARGRGRARDRRAPRRRLRTGLLTDRRGRRSGGRREPGVAEVLRDPDVRRSTTRWPSWSGSGSCSSSWWRCWAPRLGGGRASASWGRWSWGRSARPPRSADRRTIWPTRSRRSRAPPRGSWPSDGSERPPGLPAGAPPHVDPGPAPSTTIRGYDRSRFLRTGVAAAGIAVVAGGLGTTAHEPRERRGIEGLRDDPRPRGSRSGAAGRLGPRRARRGSVRHPERRLLPGRHRVVRARDRRGHLDASGARHGRPRDHARLRPTPRPSR